MSFTKLIKILNDKSYTISTIESLTGGGFAYFLTQVPGASSVFEKSLVTYSNESKMEAGVNKDILKQYGAVSNEVALEMLSLLDSDIAISFTGNAGPISMDDKPVGRVYIGIRILDKIEILEFNFKGDREEIRKQSIEAILYYLLEYFQN